MTGSEATVPDSNDISSSQTGLSGTQLSLLGPSSGNIHTRQAYLAYHISGLRSHICNKDTESKRQEMPLLGPSKVYFALKPLIGDLSKEHEHDNQSEPSLDISAWL